VCMRACSYHTFIFLKKMERPEGVGHSVGKARQGKARQGKYVALAVGV
jgi:hypothetical protein